MEQEMKRFKSGSILIVDDETSICELLHEFFSSLGIKSTTLTDPFSIQNQILKEKYDVFMLDVCMPGVNGIDLVPHISERCPDSKVIIMTGYADKETAIKALKYGAFDFLEKPFELELIIHTVRRAFEVLKAERNQRKLLDDLRQSQKDLLQSKKQMEHLNDQLMETNKALSVLAQNIALEREQTERQVAFKIKSLVIPAIQKLKQHGAMERYGAELYVLVNQLVEDLTSGFIKDETIMSTLSPAELRIASLIRGGFSTDQIADQLSIAPSTVRTHRKNIRRKLKINDKQYSLKNFLLTKSASW